MENNEEVLDIKEEPKNEEVLSVVEPTLDAVTETPVSDKTEVIEPADVDKIKTEYETVNEEIEVPKKKSHKALIIILSILLFFDVAALVIYLIGINNVFSFIK